MRISKFKKFIILLIICADLFCLSGCGKNESEQQTAQGLQTVRITFPEGYTVAQYAALLEENNVCSESDFLKQVNTQNEFTQSVENASERPFYAEGYLFPDTYDFYVGESPENALNRFFSNMKSKLTDSDYSRAESLGYSMDEIIIIASIIQTECSIVSEMDKVSSVLHNRLSSNNYLQQLQCDATYFYITNYVVPYTEKYGIDAEKDTDALYEKYAELYNTYRFKGLPAGPICNPGKAAIQAALNPADTEYYYFVTDSDGAYHYSETYEEHLSLCNKFGIKTA